MPPTATFFGEKSRLRALLDHIAAWGEAHLSFLREILPYHHGVPGGRWLTLLMNRIDPALFSACFTAWVWETWPDRLDLVAIDGKTSRRSHDHGAGKAPLHLVSAFAITAHLVLDQEAAIAEISYPSTGYQSDGPAVLLGGYTWRGPDTYKFNAMQPEERIEWALRMGETIHPQYRDEFKTGVAVSWHKVPWVLGCSGVWEDRETQGYDDAIKIDNRVVCAGEHLSYLPAWQEGAILSSLYAVSRLHDKVINGCLKTTFFTAVVFAGLSVASAHGQSEDEVTARPEEAKISELADQAEFGAAGYTSTDGEVLYQTHCSGCHMPDGRGAVGAGKYPALKNNENLEFASYPIYIIVNGQGAMPGFGSFFDDEQIAAITSYIQSNLDNGYEPDATPEMVAGSRPAKPADLNTEEHE